MTFISLPLTQLTPTGDKCFGVSVRARILLHFIYLYSANITAIKRQMYWRGGGGGYLTLV